MVRTGLRLLMTFIGLVMLVFYTAAAALGYLVLTTLVSSRIDLVTTILAVAVLTLLMSYLSYRYGTADLLSRLQATPVAPERAPRIYRQLTRLSAQMGVPRPTLAIAHLDSPNALAFSRPDDGVIVLDRSLIRLLDEDELRGILAHELAHLASRDALIGTFAYSLLRTVAGLLLVAIAPLILLITGFARAISWIRGRPESWSGNLFGQARRAVEGSVVVLLAVLTVALLSLSRRREYAADDRAASVTGDPIALARALQTIQRASQPEWGLLSPLVVHSETDDPLSRLFSTHPAIDERIERLVERARRDADALGLTVE